jgi:3-hydroxyacyl-CoA dehydrogenase
MFIQRAKGGEKIMNYSIRKAAVIGSGVMGAGIAAHLANVGIPVYMFDIVPKELNPEEEKKGLTLESKEVRNRIAEQNKQLLLKQKPAPLYDKHNLSMITACNLEDDLDKLSEVDWIVEVVVENLAIKKKVFEQIEQFRKPEAIVSSNTSGISVEAMVVGRSEEFSKHFLGTHFFNPPRYLKLLEVIPTSKTDLSVTQFMTDFGEKVLGKGVVIAKDTPNFIANRIGCYGLMVTVDEMIKNGYSVGEVDSVTGPALGRPKSATFRTLDVVGLDTFVHVSQNVYDNVDDEEEKNIFNVPAFMKQMVENKWFGSKSGQGFYKKVKGEQGSEILELDISTLEYVPRKKLKAASLEQSKGQKGLANKLQTLIYAKDRAGELTWNITKKVLLYSADKVGEIADDIASIDNAMRWGFGWELGPFEFWDAIGLEKSVARMEKEGESVPSWVKEWLASGKTGFYEKNEGKTFYLSDGAYRELDVRPEEISLAALKEQNKVIKKNAGASLIDLGDGVACLEFHSPNNAIGADILQMINFSVDEVAKNYDALVIGNQAKNFCVGANVMLILMEAQEQNWFEIDMMVRQFQQTMGKIRFSEKPVVVAPFGMSLGGGVEVALPAARIQASAETYMGLVEVGVGLIPGGGGNKELLMRLLDGLPEGSKLDPQELVNFAFETVAMAKVSTSAAEAKKFRYIRPEDGISINQSHLIYDAKQSALALARSVYRPPQPRKIPVVGEAGKAVLKLGAYTMKASAYISDHDMKIASKLAHVLSGGDLPSGTLVDEQYLLDIEREAFLSLVGEPKSQARMQHMLTKGKPLRN